MVSQIRMPHSTGHRVHTGVVSSGVVMGVQELFSFTPLPKSKSQIFTGDTYKGKQNPGAVTRSWRSWGQQHDRGLAVNSSCSICQAIFTVLGLARHLRTDSELSSYFLREKELK